MNNSVLILGVPRSGTTSLCHAFGKNLKEIEEPLNPFLIKRLSTKKLFEKCKEKNIVLKTMVDHKPFDWTGSKESFIIELCSYFDNIILLDRKDTNRQVESYSELAKNLNRSGGINRDSINFVLQKGEYTKLIYYQKYLIREISDRLKLRLYYYEDIFSDNYLEVFNSLDIDINLLDYKYINPENRYTNAHTSITFPKTII